MNDADRVTLPGNVPAQARPEFDQGLSATDLPMERVVLVLGLRPGVQAERDAFIASLHDPKSPNYHQWLTPEQYGQRYGISDSDLNAIVTWLQSYGFKVEEIAKGRGWINFSGTTGQIESAFRTEIHNYLVNGQMHHANALPPSIPAGLSDIVLGPLSLHDFRKPSNITHIESVSPDYTSGSSHYLAPADVATIYDINPLYSATPAINGTGQTIAIVGRTDIKLSDVTTFRSFFGLPANSPHFINNGPDPGNLGGGEETEADLDVEWSGALAPNATIDFVISASTGSTDGTDLSAQYIVDNNLGSAMSESFGQCEQLLGTDNAFYNNTWAQAASQGITAFVSSGDSGAAGCQDGGSTTGTIRAVNGLASTPFNVAVGGTEFMDTTNPSLYWNSTNNSTNKGSAIQFIPEMVWNESGTVSGGSDLWSSGGGASTLYSQPSWQVANGLPPGGMRAVPDVSLSAAGHDGYLMYQEGGLYSVGGTSASSPSWASLMALVNQKTGSRQGNANTVLYPMQVAQFAGGPAVFHDTTVGNNSVPGVTGFNAITGYDMATGLGSVDVAVMVNNWGAPLASDFFVSAGPTSASIAQGHSTTTTITTLGIAGFSSAVTLSASSVPTNVTVGFSPNPIAAPGSGTSTMTVTVGSTVPVGSYTLTVNASGGGQSHFTTFIINVVAAADFTISASPASVSVAQGSQGTSTITTAVLGGFSNAITLSAISGVPSGTTVGFSPNPIAAPGAGTSTMTMTVGASTTPGAYTITVQGSGGSVTHTTTVTLTVSPSGGAWTKLFDFRGSSGFVVDPPNATYVLSNTVYPTTRNSVTFGWQSTSNLDSRDRNTAVDPRLAGINFVPDNVAPATFEVDLPSPGTYNINLALGDDLYGQCGSGCKIEFRDGSTSLFTVSPHGTTGGFFYDANGSNWSAASWPASNLTKQVNMSGSKLLVLVGANDGVSDVTPIAHLAVTQVAVTPDFTISASPNTATVVQGNSGTSTITTTVSGGFSNAVTLSAISGVPAGTTVSFAPNPIAAPGSGTSTMTMNVGASTAPGQYTITVQGSGGSSTHTTTVTLTVIIPPDYTIGASPNTVSVAQGGQGTSTITTTGNSSFNSAVTLSAISGVPTGTTVTFAPNPIAAPGSGTSTMTMNVGASTATGMYTITVQGSGGGITHTTTVTLTVTAAANDFSLTANPTTVSVAQGNSGTSTITTTALGTFNNAITLSTISGVPSGTTVTFAPNPIAAPGSGTSTMTMNVGASTATGQYTITVQGMGGASTHTATVTLTVTAAVTWQKLFDFRATAAFVTDPANGTYVLPNTVYPTSRNGVSFGWGSTANLDGRDRSTAVDARLAGINFVPDNITPVAFKVDLPSPGTYDIALAMGDDLFGQCPYGCKVQFMDGATSLFTVTAPSGTTSGSFYDAKGTNLTAAAWPGGNQTMRVTLAGSQLTMLVGANDGKSDITPLAHLSITQVSSNPVPDFSIGASPNSVTVVQGNSGTSTITTAVSGGFANDITLSAISGVPSGTTVSFAPNPIVSPGAGTSTMTINVGASTATGQYTLTVQGTGGGVTHTTTVTLTVTAAADFAISAAPNSVSVAQGNSGSSTITTTVVGGFSNAVTLSTISGVPAGTTVTFAPNPIPAPGAGSSTMTINVGASTATGQYTITVQGVGGTSTHTTTVTLTVTTAGSGFQQGFDFRATSGFVTDPGFATWVTSSTAYPTTRNGVTFGWQVTTNLDSRDRNTAVDPRLAGINFVYNNVAPAVFEVDLPAAGTYTINLAMGDDLYGQCGGGCKIEFRDGATSLFTIAEPGTLGGMFFDANGNNLTAAAWPASNTTHQVTMSGTKLLVLVGANDGKSDVTPIAHLAVTQVP